MGHHVLLNIYGCSQKKLQDLESFVTEINTALKDAKAEAVGSSTYKFGPPGNGFTCLILLTTSHLSIHTWPEWGSAAVDVFTCGDVDTDLIVRSMVRYFESIRHTIEDIPR